MPEFCTCGAKLPEDALFCHKCGKPQREMLLAEPDELPPPLPPPPAAPEPPRIGFHNRVAVWIALRIGILAFLLSAVTGYFAVVWLVAGGFYCVYLYRKRTGQTLSVWSGAHLGWLAGIFGFVISTVLVTILVAALTQPEFVTVARAQWRNSFSENDVNQMIDLLHSPGGIASLLAMFFVSFTLLTAAGGALGAKLLNRGGSASHHRNA